MQFGLYISNFGPFHEPGVLVELAHEAEEQGWAGFFLSDNLRADDALPALDTWTTLTAIAVRTARIRLGPLVTAVPRRHPARLAREAVTLDRLAQGRLVLGVGSGDDHWREYSTFGVLPSDKERGAMLDEGLAVLMGLWSGEPFSFHGTYYQVEDAEFLPTPVQQPRIPIWVAGNWPHKKPYERAAAWDGVYPNALDRERTVDEYRAMRAYITAHRTATTPFAMVHAHPIREPVAQPTAAQLADYAEAGVTWWLSYFDWNSSVSALQAHIRRGPPRE